MREIFALNDTRNESCATGSGDIAFFAVACTKDPVIPPTTPANAISKLEKDGDSWEVSYNPDGSVQQLIRRLADSSVFARYDFVYANGRLLEINSGGKWKYYYTGDQLTRIDTYNSLGVLRYRSAFAYMNGKITGRTNYYANTPVPLRPLDRIRYTHNADGNVVVKQHFDYVNDDWRKTEAVHVLAYDDRPNSYEHLETFPYLPASLLSVNNPLREEYIGVNGQSYGSAVHEYQYNTAGKPARRRVTYAYTGFPDTHSGAKFHY